MESMEEPLSPKFTENDLVTVRYMNIIDEGDNIARRPVHSQSKQKIQQIHPIYSSGVLEAPKSSWNFDIEKITVKEKIIWLEKDNQINYVEKQLNDWIKVNAIDPNSEVDIAESVNFCEECIVRRLFDAKRVFERLNPIAVYSARSKANPFETVKNVFFLNRAALKMANIDAACNFLFTTIEETDIYKPERKPISFVDLCAGPGGFSEYILYRKKWLYRGYGITLRTPPDNDFRVLNSDYASAGSFQAIYGPNHTGDVRNPDVFNDFINRVKFQSCPGVYFVMCDGGIPVVGVEGNQEILMKHLIVCQVLIALSVLRKGGHFLMKHFDMFTDFSVGLFYLLHNCFTRVGVIKPNASRPGNSERYIVCSGFLSTQQTTVIKNVLVQLAEKLWAYTESKLFLDLVQIVPVEEIKRDVDFTNYIVSNITRIAMDQIVALNKMDVFARNRSLKERRQYTLRQRCLEYWKLPDEKRTKRKPYTIENLLKELGITLDIFDSEPKPLENETEFRQLLKSLSDWYYVYLQSDDLINHICVFVGLDRCKTLQYRRGNWIRIDNLSLAKGTLLYGELVKERCYAQDDTEKVNPHYKPSLHVIDALYLGGFSLQKYDLGRRKNFIDCYCKALNREMERGDHIRLRGKTLRPCSKLVKHIKKDLDNSDDMNKTTSRSVPILGWNTRSEEYDVKGLMFLKDALFEENLAQRAVIFKDSSETLTFEDVIDIIEKSQLKGADTVPKKKQKLRRNSEIEDDKGSPINETENDPPV